MSIFKRHTKEQLGQVLIQRGVITPEQLSQALEAQKKQGGLLGEILTKLNFTAEEDIAQALAIQHDFPYLPLANYEIDPQAARVITADFARRHCILPVDKMGDIITVVMANPLDTEALEKIEAMTKCKIEVFVATHTEIKQAINASYGQGNKAEDNNG